MYIDTHMCLVSLPQDEIRGFGFPMSEAELRKVNEWRSLRKKPPLASSPGLRLLNYGKNKDGYWTAEMFAQQVDDLMDCFDVLHPDHQLLFEVDWSGNHSASRKDALIASRMNVGVGGKQPIPHDSFIDPEHAALMLGPAAAEQQVMRPVLDADGQPVLVGGKVQEALVTIDMKLKPGDTQKFYFTASDLPPFSKPSMPKYNTAKVDRKGRPVLNKDKKQVYEKGYVDAAKGMEQILWERGLWQTGMVARLDDDDDRPLSLSMHHVLSECWDFANETTALMERMGARGHILLMCVKGHPELAGVGIENSWGKSAMKFRRDNDCVARNLVKNVLASLQVTNLPLLTVRKFARKTREYMRAYKADAAETESHWLVEKLRRIFKCHRSSLDFDYKFIRDS